MRMRKGCEGRGGTYVTEGRGDEMAWLELPKGVGFPRDDETNIAEGREVRLGLVGKLWTRSARRVYVGCYEITSLSGVSSRYIHSTWFREHSLDGLRHTESKVDTIHEL